MTFFFCSLVIGLEPWYVEQQELNERLAAELGYPTVWQLKHAVALTIRNYVEQGGFLFAMCSATDTIDIALAWLQTDIVPAPFDNTPYDPSYRSQVDYTHTFAFQDFKLMTNPMVYEFSDLDTSNYAMMRGAMADYFTLFAFAAGQGLSEHTAPFDAVVQVLDGEAVLIADEVKEIADAVRRLLDDDDLYLPRFLESQAAFLDENEEVDLVMCDEAHRTAGISTADGDDTAFVKVHDDAVIPADPVTNGYQDGDNRTGLHFFTNIGYDNILKHVFTSI